MSAPKKVVKGVFTLALLDVTLKVGAAAIAVAAAVKAVQALTGNTKK